MKLHWFLLTTCTTIASLNDDLKWYPDIIVIIKKVVEEELNDTTSTRSKRSSFLWERNLRAVIASRIQVKRRKRCRQETQWCWWRECKEDTEGTSIVYKECIRNAWSNYDQKAAFVRWIFRHTICMLLLHTHRRHTGSLSLFFFFANKINDLMNLIFSHVVRGKNYLETWCQW